MGKKIRNIALILIIFGIGVQLFATGGAQPAEKQYGATEPLPPAVSQAEKESGAKPAREATTPASQATQLEERIKADAKDTAALSELGKLYLQQKNYPRAADLFSAALELSPDDNNLRNDFATALLFQGMTGMAEKQFRRIIQAEPENPERYLNLAIVLSHKNPPSIEEAVIAWQKVVELDGSGELAEKAKVYLARYQQP